MRRTESTVHTAPIPTFQFDLGDHVELARALEASLLARKGPGADLVSDEGRLYGYDGTIWKEIPREYLSVVVQSFSGEPVRKRRLKVSASDVSGAIKLLHDQRSRKGFFLEAPAGIAFSNGFAVVTADGVELRPHAAEHRARHAYPFALPDANDLPEPFLRFCEEIYEPDADRAEKILAIQEHGGACIAGIATTYERAMLLVGKGNTGKSRLSRFFVAAMPPGTVTGLPPSLMHDQYALPILAGSRLNVVPDIGREKITGAVKGIVSGERRTVRSPGERACDLWPRAGHLFGVNPPMPEIEDTSSGYERRWVIITHNREFPESDSKRDPEIAEKILAKCTSQVVRLFLGGAVRLMKNRKHTLPSSHHLVLDGWMRRGDPIRRFVEHGLVVGRGWTRASELYAAFPTWLSGFGERHPVTLQAFVQKLKELKVASSERGDGTYYAAVVRGTGVSR